ncbi:unnamed protein product, partial [Owenia fusiformis]
MAMDQSYHNKALSNICRLCASKVLTYKQITAGNKAQSCITFQETILNKFDIDISKDEENVHPKNICHNCFRNRLKNDKLKICLSCHKSTTNDKTQNEFIDKVRSTDKK